MSDVFGGDGRFLWELECVWRGGLGGVADMDCGRSSGSIGNDWREERRLLAEGARTGLVRVRLSRELERPMAETLEKRRALVC